MSPTKEIINPSQYIELSSRTDRVKDSLILDKTQRQLLHAVLGLVTESSELTDIVKRHLYYCTPIDSNHLIEELGDLMWYIAIICREYDVSIEEIMERNINKLKKRYPEGFTEFHAVNRNLEAENTVLNKDNI